MNPRRRRIRRAARAERRRKGQPWVLTVKVLGHCCLGRDPIYGHTVRVLESRVSEGEIDPPPPLEPGLYRACHAYPPPTSPATWVKMRPLGGNRAFDVRLELL